MINKINTVYFHLINAIYLRLKLKLSIKIQTKKTLHREYRSDREQPF